MGGGGLMQIIKVKIFHIKCQSCNSIECDYYSFGAQLEIAYNLKTVGRNVTWR